MNQQNTEHYLSNWNYRRYIQKNANDIMKYNMMAACNNSGNNPYILYNNQVGPNVPFVYKNIYDNRMPPIANTDSDLKQNYLNNIQIKARMVSPSINTKNF
jgi:hypothetical protein